MGQNRLMHDAAFAGATALTDLVKPPPGQGHDFHREAYQIIINAIEAYERQRARQAYLLRPMEPIESGEKTPA